jgi:rare lipoprotein A
MATKLLIFFILFFVCLSTGCSSEKVFIEKSYEHYQKTNKSYVLKDIKYTPKKHTDIDTHEEYGMASWYTTKKFPKAITASGDIFNPNALTAAHRTLPFMSVVRVTSLFNNKSINVIINDRGPFINNRIIDLSERAAKNLEFKHRGITKVKIEYLKKESIDLKNKILKRKNKLYKCKKVL